MHVPGAKVAPGPINHERNQTLSYAELVHLHESEMLNLLNIQPTSLERASPRLFDVKFSYEKRWYTDPRDAGRTVQVFTHEPGKKVQQSSFVMPRASELQRVRASAWMPLLMIGLAHDKFCTQVCRLAFGSPLPDYAGDWSFIRDKPTDELWALFDKVRHRWFSLPTTIQANFAQP